MNKKIPILFFVFLFLFSCSKTEKRVIKLEVKQAENSYFEIKNQGKKTATFTIDINGKGLYNLDKMFDFIRNKYPDIPVAEKVWRFVSHYSRHLKLITKNDWLYNPLLLMNSAGGSYCGFRSAAMTNILLNMGEKVRSWSLNGHVVTEVFFDGRWQVYDPDLGVVYYNKNGAICNYYELCNNPVYITSPVKIISISSYCDSVKACSSGIAEMYSSINDNNLFNTYYEQFEEKQQIMFSLPPRSKLVFPIPDDSIDTYYALACLDLPKGWTGTVKIPLIPYDIIGNAEITYQNKIMPPDHSNWSQSVSASKKYENEIKILTNINGVTLRYYINPYLFSPEKNNIITFVGEGLDFLELNCKEYCAPLRPDWENHCGPDYVNWLNYIASWHSSQKVAVRNYNDYIGKIKLIEQCGAFNKFGVDSEEFYDDLERNFESYKNRDSTFWKKFEDDKYLVHSLLKIIKSMDDVSEKK